MKVAGDAGDDLSVTTDAFSGEVGLARHLFEAWELRPAREVAEDYGRDGIDWALVVDGRWTGSDALAELGLVLVLARQAAPQQGPPLVLICDDFDAVQNGDQITVAADRRVQLDHVDGLTTVLTGLRRS